MFTVTPTMLYLIVGVFVVLAMIVLCHYHISLAARLKKLNVLEDTQVSYFLGAFALMSVVVPTTVFVVCIGMLMHAMQSGSGI